jgi:hypothetical protein
MKVRVLLVILLLTFASSLYWFQAKNSADHSDLGALVAAKVKTIPEPEAQIPEKPAPTGTQGQQAETDIIAVTKQPSAAKSALQQQLCTSYTKPVCQLKRDIQLQQHLLRNNNLFMDSAALVIGSSNYADALLQLSTSKIENEDFSTEQDIRDYLTKELSGEVYQLQLGCGIGICMASISTGPNSDLGQDLSKMQGLGSSVVAEFEHPDHREIRLIFLAGKNANNGMTGTSNNTAAPTH